MKFGLNWKGAAGVFVILIILLVVLLSIKTGRKETIKEIRGIKPRENAEELVQKETDNKMRPPPRKCAKVAGLKMRDN